MKLQLLASVALALLSAVPGVFSEEPSASVVAKPIESLAGVFAAVSDETADRERTFAGKSEKRSRRRRSRGGRTRRVQIGQGDMDALVNAFCDSAVAISDAFWSNGGKHHSRDDAYPQAACDAAYRAAVSALYLAYNYPDPVLFKPTLTTAPHTFRPTIQGALSYFIGTDCLLKAGDEEDQYPPGNDGSNFREYGFALANYDDAGTYAGFSGCDWVPDSYVTGESVGVAQGQVAFQRTEGAVTTVDKTFSFGFAQGPSGSDTIVMNGHHSSQIIDAGDSIQYVF